MFKPTAKADLYILFRNGLLTYILDTEDTNLRDWQMVPKEHHIGRMQTVSMVRKMLKRLGKEFPKGMVLLNGKIAVTEEFKAFLQTHREMGSTAEEAITAWTSMRELADDAG